jgi:hypothetical protein
MLDELEDLNDYFSKNGWKFNFNLNNNNMEHIYNKNNDYFKLLFNRLDTINITVPIHVGDYKVNYNTTFKSFYMALDYIYFHLDNYEDNNIMDKIS